MTPLSDASIISDQFLANRLASRPLSYAGPVTLSRSSEILDALFLRKDQAPFENQVLLVSSCGGPTGAGMYFYDAVRSGQLNLTTIGTGDVDSSGIIIFLAGTRRIISPRTTLLLHEAGRRFDPHQRFTARELEAMAREDRLKDEQYAEAVATNTHTLTQRDVLTLMRNNTVLSPEECITLGLAHALLS